MCTTPKEPRVNVFPADHYPHGSEVEMELNSALSELNEHTLPAQQWISAPTMLSEQTIF